jgi:hypothetical protein
MYHSTVEAKMIFVTKTIFSYISKVPPFQSGGMI